MVCARPKNGTASSFRLCTARKYAEEIRKAGMQATGLVRQLLAVARPAKSEPRLLSLNEAFTSGPLVHTTDLPREVANLPLPDSSNGDGHGKGHGKIIPRAELERQTILSVVTELNGDKLQAARLLGIGKTTLYRKLKITRLTSFNPESDFELVSATPVPQRETVLPPIAKRHVFTALFMAADVLIKRA